MLLGSLCIITEQFNNFNVDGGHSQCFNCLTTSFWALILRKGCHLYKAKARCTPYGLVRDLNPGPLAPKARIIPLDQRAQPGVDTDIGPPYLCVVKTGFQVAEPSICTHWL